MLHFICVRLRLFNRHTHINTYIHTDRQKDIQACRKVNTRFYTDTTGEQIEVDVGRCRRRCGGKKQLKKQDVQRLMLENPDMDPRLVGGLRLFKATGFHTCLSCTRHCSLLGNFLSLIYSFFHTRS